VNDHPHSRTPIPRQPPLPPPNGVPASYHRTNPKASHFWDGALGTEQAVSSRILRLLDVECGSWGKPDECGIPTHGQGHGLDRWRNGMRQKARRKGCRDFLSELFRVKTGS
jgi:hypothetical protein